MVELCLQYDDPRYPLSIGYHYTGKAAGHLIKKIDTYDHAFLIHVLIEKIRLTKM